MVNTPHDPQHLNNQYASDAQSAETNSISEQESLGKSLSASLGAISAAQSQVMWMCSMQLAGGVDS